MPLSATLMAEPAGNRLQPPHLFGFGKRLHIGRRDRDGLGAEAGVGAPRDFVGALFLSAVKNRSSHLKRNCKVVEVWVHISEHLLHHTAEDRVSNYMRSPNICDWCATTAVVRGWLVTH